MFHRTSILALIILSSLLSACAAPASPADATQSGLPVQIQSTAIQSSPTSADPAPSNTPPSPDSTSTPIQPVQTELLPADPFYLGEPGPYAVGKRVHRYDGEIRKGQKVSLSLWYPALTPAGAAGEGIEDAPPDLSAAPYPLLLTSTENAKMFAAHLASHGFIVAGVNNQWTYLTWEANMIEYPQETIYALDQLATSAPPGLEGMINADRTGYFGYSFDGTNAFFLSGARVDPQFYLDECAKFSRGETTIPSWSPERICALTGKWDEFVARAGSAAKQPEDGLWQPYTDPRIRAVMPMAGEGAWLFGERGLAAVQAPILMIIGSQDEFSFKESEYMLQHLGSPERGMIVFVGETHMSMFEGEAFARWKHFITAFFGYHLQGQEDFNRFYSKEFVNGQENLAWSNY